MEQHPPHMNQFVALSCLTMPALVAAAGKRAGMRFLEFFAASIRNPHTRRAYARGYPLSHLYETFGLVRLTRLGHDVPWTKA